MKKNDVESLNARVFMSHPLLTNANMIYANTKRVGKILRFL